MRPTAKARRIAGLHDPDRPCTRRLAVAATLAALAVALPAAAPASAAAQACAAANATPGAVGSVTLRRALHCIVNAERAARGLRSLRGSRRLARAARMHATDMLAHHYFAHERAGWTFAGRMRTVGWVGRAGEAIAWGCGGLGVPRAIVDSWLASPPHRAIVLGSYRRLGIGLAVGSPAGGCRGGAPGCWTSAAGASRAATPTRSRARPARPRRRSRSRAPAAPRRCRRRPRP